MAKLPFKISFLFLFISATVLGRNLKAKFLNYQVIEVGGVKNFESGDDFFTKLNLPLDDDLEILREDALQGTAQVLVRPGLLDTFLEGVRHHKLSYKVVVENVEKLIWNSEEFDRNNAEKDLKGSSTFERYMNFEEIESYLQTVAKTYPNKVKRTTIGKSFQGENITMVTITDHTRLSKGRVKPIIFVEAGAHAREWIAIASTIYLIEKLSETTSALTREVEWRIVPVANPDGYKYTWSENRMWRKNRRNITNSKCVGVDINRNFDSYWRKAGASIRVCSSIYAGEKAFSEPESRAIRDAVLNPEIKHRVKAYVSVHSYGQMILLPPGYHKHVMPEKCDNLLNSVGRKMSEAIWSASATKFTFGSPPKLLYPATGGSMDWALLTEDIPLAFTFELRDKGKSNFLFPVARIKLAVNDLWAAMNTLSDVVTHSGSCQSEVYVHNPEACRLQIKSNTAPKYPKSQRTSGNISERPVSETTQSNREMSRGSLKNDSESETSGTSNSGTPVSQETHKHDSSTSQSSPNSNSGTSATQETAANKPDSSASETSPNSNSETPASQETSVDKPDSSASESEFKK